MRRDYGRVLLYLGILIGILLFMKYVLVYILPLLVAVLVVVPIRRFCFRHGICRKKGSGLVAGGVLVVLLLLLIFLIVAVATFILGKAQEFLGNQMVWKDEFMTLVSDCCGWMETYVGMEGAELESWITERITGGFGIFLQKSSSWLSKSFQYLAGMARVCTFGLVSFICVVLFAREIESWQQGLLNLAALEPAIDRLLSVVLRLGKKIGTMLKTYFKTQSIIFCCISMVAVGGLYVAKVSDAWFYGILAGFMDVLPFIGTGIVLVPTAIVRLLQGNPGSAAVVIVTYVLCIVIREFLEPRLLGNGMRFSPVAILISVYAGILFYGVGGVLLGPITLLILVEVAKEIFIQ